ncbi:MAG: hypothetical protein IPL27_26670 [Lewinellaceae bacterium]|nr:hypothetical protein [Lewinellaceae bacterium]
MADVNNDGYPDIFVTEMLPGDDLRLKTTTQFDSYSLSDLKLKRGFYHQYMQNCLQIFTPVQAASTGGGVFTETAHFSGVAATDWSRARCFSTWTTTAGETFTFAMVSFKTLLTRTLPTFLPAS